MNIVNIDNILTIVLSFIFGSGITCWLAKAILEKIVRDSLKKEMEEIKQENPGEIDNDKLRERVELLEREKELEEQKSVRVEKKKTPEVVISEIKKEKSPKKINFFFGDN